MTNGIKEFWMELMNLQGFSEFSGELGTIGIIPVLVFGLIHWNLRILAYFVETKRIKIGFRMDTTCN
jgi:hypothetical protein